MRIGFDLDGTLVSCYHKQMRCLRDGAGLAEATIDWEAVWNKKRNGSTNVDAFRQLRVDNQLSTEILRFWRINIESREYQKLDQIFPEARICLEKLKRLGSLHLVSARASRSNLHHQLSRLNLSTMFDTVDVVDGTDVTKSKADVFALLELNCYVGDTEHDWQASRRAGIGAYIVSTGQRSLQFLERHHVNPVYNNLCDVSEEINALFGE